MGSHGGQPEGVDAWRGGRHHAPPWGFCSACSTGMAPRSSSFGQELRHLSLSPPHIMAQGGGTEITSRARQCRWRWGRMFEGHQGGPRRVPLDPSERACLGLEDPERPWCTFSTLWRKKKVSPSVKYFFVRMFIIVAIIAFTKKILYVSPPFSTLPVFSNRSVFRPTSSALKEGHFAGPRRPADASEALGALLRGAEVAALRQSGRGPGSSVRTWRGGRWRACDCWALRCFDGLHDRN